MKKVFLIIIATTFLSFQGYAQEKDGTEQSDIRLKTFKMTKSVGKIHIDLGNAIIEGHSGNEIIFSSRTKATKEDERAKGLKAINGLGLVDNTGLGINVTEVNGVMQVSQMNSTYPSEVKILVPNGMIIVFDHQSKFGKSVVVRNIKSEIEISTRECTIDLDNVSGPAVIKTIYGDIKALFSQNVKGPLSIISINGDIDVTLPKTVQADLKMSTKYGELFIAPELKIDVQKHDKMTSYNNQVNAKINGGGFSIDLRSNAGKIYLRTK